tara:strand:- start:230 stop:1030 length:801 start_codon:yes stop_codon:yes gene_type:complete
MSQKLGLSLSLPSIKTGGASAFKNLYSLDFDGVDDYVDFGDQDIFTPNNSGGNRGMSFSYWAKLPNIASQTLIAKSGVFYSGAYHYEYRLRTNFAGKPFITFYGNDNASIFVKILLDTPIVVNTWTHIAFTWNLGSTNADLIGYINGVKHSAADGNATFSSGGTWSAVVNTLNTLYQGKDGGASFGGGKLDEFAIFDDNLSTAKVQAIYNSGTPTDLSGEQYLIGYWRNGDTAGTSVYPTIEDYSSEGNDGTMTNMTSGDIVTDTP